MSFTNCDNYTNETTICLNYHSFEYSTLFHTPLPQPLLYLHQFYFTCIVFYFQHFSFLVNPKHTHSYILLLCIKGHIRGLQGFREQQFTFCSSWVRHSILIELYCGDSLHLGVIKILFRHRCRGAQRQAAILVCIAFSFTFSN